MPKSENATTSLPAARNLSRSFPGLSSRSTEGRSWKGVSVARLCEVVDEVSSPALASHTIFINVGQPYRLEEKLDGRVYRTSGVRGDVAIIPAGTPAEARSREKEPQKVDCFVVNLDPGFVFETAERADVDSGGIELVGTLGSRDPAIERVGMSLLSELENGGLLGDIYVESLVTALTVHLLRNHSSLGESAARKAGRSPDGGLSKSALRRVTDYVEENLSRNLALAELSGVVHMSPFHFSRMFKLSIGLSPHQYIIRRRVERAKNLLVNTDLPLHEVAWAAGFSDQSHLAKHTRRLLGISPRALRLASG